MYAKDTFLNKARKWQVVEHFGAVPPHVYAAVLAQALIIESVNLSNLTALVIAPDEAHTTWEAHLKDKEQQEAFDAVVPSVNEVPHEDVIRVRDVPSHTEKLHEVVELSMDISDNRARRGHAVHILFLVKDVLGLCAKLLYFALLDDLTFQQGVKVAFKGVHYFSQ
jgi:predicted transposase YbfD/YdcC